MNSSKPFTQEELGKWIFDLENLEDYREYTWKHGGIVANVLGKKRWYHITDCTLKEHCFSDSENPTRSERKEWGKRTKDYYIKEYGFDPLTMFLLSIAIRIAVELIIAWWKNRND